MKILKKENWWIWLMLLILSQTTSVLVLGALVDVYDKKSWYAKGKYWYWALLSVLIIFLLVPKSLVESLAVALSLSIMIPYMMVMVLYVQILCLTAAKLEVPGKEIYLSPYIWLLCLIVPILGWTMLVVMFIYLIIWTIVMLYRGAGEKYIN
ncbi:MAG: hypothetical protein PHD10_02415 [Bacilli bacterium]|nr:hypothetical protein [Bacilli bacterium]MDD4607965.1 hypothetical protein [Bacilli bacterium]